MTDALSADDLNKYRQILEALKGELQSMLDMTEENEKPVALDTAIGRLTRMDAMQQRSMEQANRRSAEARLRQVGAAIERLARGEYGLCLACEEPLSPARLSVRPEATLCVDCQSRREKR